MFGCVWGALPPAPAHVIENATRFNGRVTTIYAQDIQHRKGADFMDRNYIAEVEVTASTIDTIKVGSSVFVKYWSPLKRPAGFTGPQGQNYKPKEGDVCKFFVEPDGSGAAWEAIEPDGIRLDVPRPPPALGEDMPSKPVEDL